MYLIADGQAIRPHKKQAAPKGTPGPAPASRLAKNPRLPATMFTGPTAGPSSTATVTKVKDDPSSGTVPANSKLSAAAVGQGQVGQVGIAKSKKVGKQSAASRKARLKSELGKEKALEKKAVLEERVKGREERKVSP